MGHGARLLIRQGPRTPLPPPRPILGSGPEAPSDPPLLLLRTTLGGTTQPWASSQGQAGALNGTASPIQRAIRGHGATAPCIHSCLLSSHSGGQASYVFRARCPASPLTVFPRASWDQAFLIAQVWFPHPALEGLLWHLRPWGELLLLACSLGACTSCASWVRPQRGTCGSLALGEERRKTTPRAGPAEWPVALQF